MTTKCLSFYDLSSNTGKSTWYLCEPKLVRIEKSGQCKMVKCKMVKCKILLKFYDLSHKIWHNNVMLSALLKTILKIILN